jgi:predicted nucleotidyltransferase
MCDAIGLSASVCDKLKAVFAHSPAIQQVVLYGSRAKGNFRPNSDIDLTIKGDLDWKTFTQLETELDDLLLPYKIDLSLFSHLENEKLIEHIQRVGKVFYQKNVPCCSETGY